MYKSKLQEYCQSKAWNLPEYSTVKEGFDHCPQFKATVIVNGSPFTTPHSSKSSKEAQNLVAKLAFDNLTGSLSASSSSPVRPACSDIKQAEINETPSAALLSGVNSVNSDQKKTKEIGHLYKNQLQLYAQKRNLVLPTYVSEREGPPHACRFKSKVVLEGKTYESVEYLSTMKDAENAAAKVALMAVAMDVAMDVACDRTDEEDPSFSKNVLQELSQKAYSCLPEYNTTRTGSSHMPKFISSVEIKGESFKGQEAKTKKLAEMNAAKVAYAALKERQLKQKSVPFTTSSHVGDTTHSLFPKERSTIATELSQQTIPGPVFGSSDTTAEEARYNEGASQQMTAFQCVEPKVTTDPDCSTNSLRSRNLPSPVQLSSKPGRSSESKPAAASDSSSSYKKVKVYPHTPNMTFPPGTTIMHKDEKWVAVTTEDSIHGNA